MCSFSPFHRSFRKIYVASSPIVFFSCFAKGQTFPISPGKIFYKSTIICLVIFDCNKTRVSFQLSFQHQKFLWLTASIIISSLHTQRDGDSNHRTEEGAEETTPCSSKNTQRGVTRAFLKAHDITVLGDSPCNEEEKLGGMDARGCRRGWGFLFHFHKAPLFFPPLQPESKHTTKIDVRNGCCNVQDNKRPPRPAYQYILYIWITDLDELLLVKQCVEVWTDMYVTCVYHMS